MSSDPSRSRRSRSSRPTTTSASSPPRTPEGRRLPARLREVAAQVPAHLAVADIGSGDGLLAAHLARVNSGRRVIATENKSGPRATVAATVAGLGVDVRLGEGFTVLAPGEVEVAVLAGMGGHRMAALLQASPEVVATLRLLILQPMQHLGPLLDKLDEWGFLIVRLVSVEQAGRTHTVVVAVPPYSSTDAPDRAFAPVPAPR